MKMSAVFTTPIAAPAFQVYKSRKSQEPRKLFSSIRLEFGGEFHCKKSVSWNICRRNQRIMRGSNWVRQSTSDEGVPAFEQEALVEESVGFAEGGLEATINSLWVLPFACEEDEGTIVF
ncbi:hypothetical protein ACS0TY_034646 [Phlomoides rotata]